MTDKEEREMVDSELLSMLEDVANREIPCQVAYADIQKRLAAVHADIGEMCEWRENEDGMWETACENTFVFEEDGPEENGQKFCCYCGKPLKAFPFVYPTEEETP